MKNYKDALPQVDVDKAWNNLNHKIGMVEKDNKKGLRLEGFPVFYKIAATIIVLLSVVVSLYITMNKNAETVKIETAQKEISRVILPDGSLVELNEMSALEYPRIFSTEKRYVKLNGEAYFNVYHNPAKPFIVQTNNIEIKVLGTSFNVFNRSRQKQEVYLQEGSVEVTHINKKEKSVNLLPGQIVVVQGDKMQVGVNDDINYLSWKTGKIVFKETSLDEVAWVLSHTFNCNIVFEKEELKNLKYTGVIIDQPLEKILKAIDGSFENIDITERKRDVVISQAI